MLHGTKEKEAETGSGGEGGIRVRMEILREEREGKEDLGKSEFIKPPHAIKCSSALAHLFRLKGSFYILARQQKAPSARPCGITDGRWDELVASRLQDE